MTDFANIYQQYFQDVYRFLLSLSQDETLAEEITQETFYKALQRIDTYQGTCKITVWLCQIAKNTYFSYCKKQKHGAKLGAGIGESPDTGEEILLRQEELWQIHQVLHDLDEPYKEVFTLRVFGELPFQQISALFGKSESWSRVTFFRAKRKIQDLIKEM